VLDRGGADQAYDLGLDHPVTQRGFLEGLARGAGRRSPRFVPVPSAWVRWAARMAKALALGVPGGGDMTLERALRLTLEGNPYGAERLWAELAWSPTFALGAGFERTMRWLEQRNQGDHERSD
jgi:nucleoside-diphosphate-sugar epimerase